MNDETQADKLLAQAEEQEKVVETETTKDNLKEPSRKPSKGVDVVQLVRHPEHWSFVMNAAYRSNTAEEGAPPEWAYQMMVPTWEDLPPGEPIPAHAALPVQEGATQRLFDEMWTAGFRPTGAQIIMEVMPEAMLNEMRYLRAQVAELSEYAAFKVEEVDPSTDSE